MAQELSKAQAVGTLPAVSTAVDSINDVIDLLHQELSNNEAHADRLAGGPLPAPDTAENRPARPYEDGQMAAIEDRLLVCLRMLRYANQRLATITQ